MEYTREQHIKCLKKFDIPKEGCMFVNKSALVVHGLRESTNRIEICANNETFKNLGKKYDFITTDSGKTVVRPHPDVEVSGSMESLLGRTPVKTDDEHFVQALQDALDIDGKKLKKGVSRLNLKNPKKQ